MSIFEVWAHAVRYYIDEPGVPVTPDHIRAELSYRDAFWSAAYETSGWNIPEMAVWKQSKDARDAARRAAKVRIPRSVLYGNDSLLGEEIFYCKGHEIEASRTRGRCQALKMSSHQWLDLQIAGMSGRQIQDVIIGRWRNAVGVWAGSPITAVRFVPPPRPTEFLTAVQMHILRAGRRFVANLPTPPKDADVFGINQLASQSSARQLNSSPRNESGAPQRK